MYRDFLASREKGALFLASRGKPSRDKSMAFPYGGTLLTPFVLQCIYSPHQFQGETVMIRENDTIFSNVRTEIIPLGMKKKHVLLELRVVSDVSNL